MPNHTEDDITGLQDVENHALPRTDPPDKRISSRAKLLSILITIVGMAAAAVAWAASEHDAIKDWTAEQDYATKKEVREEVEKHYVNSKDFTEVKVEQQHIKEKVDDIDEKVDEMHDLLIRGIRRSDRNRRSTDSE